MTTENSNGVVENPVMGRPYVIIKIDSKNHRVGVLSHCRHRGEAEALVDNYTTDPTTIELRIILSNTLAKTLRDERARMAAKLKDWVETPS